MAVYHAHPLSFEILIVMCELSNSHHTAHKHDRSGELSHWSNTAGAVQQMDKLNKMCYRLLTFHHKSDQSTQHIASLPTPVPEPYLLQKF